MMPGLGDDYIDFWFGGWHLWFAIRWASQTLMSWCFCFFFWELTHILGWYLGPMDWMMDGLVASRLFSLLFFFFGMILNFNGFCCFLLCCVWSFLCSLAQWAFDEEQFAMVVHFLTKRVIGMLCYPRNMTPWEKERNYCCALNREMVICICKTKEPGYIQ